ncbi:MAG: phospholipid/cholesterol/gamma-HCH transport system substrate-binding protein [Mycobacterium sp.]|jgi:virulence factor Mce-like protein|nr:phospholipid/cholesterol/gamma-HCH transport system substrate-binding protein [Mycobacterium sp.]
MRVIRDPRLWGVSALALLAILGVVAAMIYVSPPGDKVITFYTDDASSITPGITVRIAGITVGTVKDLSIEPEQVRVRATVRGSAFVGDQSTVQVRMLTVVGGYYVNVDSLGDSPLGARAIARERVTLPYSLIRALTDTTKITQGVQTAPINQSLDQVQQGLTGPNLESISSIVDAGNKLTDTLDRQRGQLSAILNLSDEYIEQLASYRGQLQELIRKVSILEQTLVLYGKGFAAALVGMGNVIQGIGPLGVFYANHRDKFLERFIHGQQIVRAWADRSGLIVRILRRTRDRMERTLDVQNAPPELLATDLCIPLPESPC